MKSSGKLYVVATPIGNMEDITLRAVRILGEVDLIAAEDTRQTGKLLACHGIKGHLISVHEHNEIERTAGLIRKLKDGCSIALVTDAGTPGVSDPGYHLVRVAIEEKISVVPIPGVSAAIAALSASGLPTDSFLFVGFLPKKSSKRLQQLHDLSNQPGTIIVYESPRRILSLLKELESVMGDRYAVLSREITKLHEEFIRGTVSEIWADLGGRQSVKGECTLLISGCEKDKPVSMEIIQEEIQSALKLKNGTVSDIVKDIARRYPLSKSRIYEEALKIKANETS
ncbi:MAG: 16S rRNA (cytidine(1402)-2'-O)-methyltransferase [Desulfobacterales bacterium]|nr:16S rRNA (cytidine(1402)-2'-O)-methyltransferase [Desulfobacterales bacterium]MDD4072336.1 16S rRNA (cytidine(1402)-2'-O)-methyltransferase [Desulfobacterales bacterium]MDD4392396.1 16S rRNA (cytidine(1402)-2'-O)-methyltransferase [Desulfobacterales bacterium]